MKIAVIGGGAAGITAAGSAQNADVTLFERGNKLGKKIYITGKGRCNFTNVCDVQTFLQNVVSNPMFLRSALSVFPPERAVELMESNGCKTKVERGRRAFPASDKASDVTKALMHYAQNNGVEVVTDRFIADIEKRDDGLAVKYVGGERVFDRVIICTGGKSYPLTGSDGSMYAVIERLGHNIVPPQPSLVALYTRDDMSEAEGLTLKNIELSADGVKPIFGDMMITADGISGPVVLTLSALTVGRTCPFKVYLDLKPSLSAEELDKRLLRDFDANKNKQFKNALDMLLPKSIIKFIIDRSGIPSDKPVNSVTKAERVGLARLLKLVELTVVGNEGFERAVVTHGGADVKQINPKTMESKLVKGLYFGGEVIDVDALTGGYNFHIALATGFVAGKNAAERL